MFNSVMRASAFYYDPKKPPKDVTSIGVETALVSKEVCVDYDVGFGNTLGYRAAPEWDETILLTWTPKGWTGDICLGKEFKFVIVSSNGQIQWENRGENRTLDQNGEAKAMTLNGIQF